MDAPQFSPAPFRLLLQVKRRILRNRVNQLLDEAPLRVGVSAAFVVLIWVSLYYLFNRIFGVLARFQEQTAVAIPYVFHIFFVAMMVLLAFSTAVLCYGALFAREEPAFLLSSPTPPAHVVGMAYLESLFFASWSMVLLGLPLMLAIGHAEDLPWYFFVLFTLTFLAFVPIPGAIGLLAAWAVAMWMPRSARRVLGFSAAVVLAAGAIWWAQLWARPAEGDGSAWLNDFLSHLALLRSAAFPSTWASKAISLALQYQPQASVFYLYVTLAHALFLSWLAIGIVSGRLQTAYARARSGIGRAAGASRVGVSRFLTNVVFFYQPPQVRTLIHKDLKVFFRDPLQWSQLAIMFGLLALYLMYLPRFHGEGINHQMRILFAFLNYSAVTLIISTFTSRFVYPMVSMEGRHIWLVGLWPMSRTDVLWAKFHFSLAVTVFAALTVTVMSVRAIGVPPVLGAVLFLSTLSVCFGLCGLAVGLGARLPNYTERSAARVASGLGGTVNLIVSLGLVLVSLAMTGAMCLYCVRRGMDMGLPSSFRWDAVTISLTSLQFVLGLIVGILSMKLGVRHFNQAEF